MHGLKHIATSQIDCCNSDIVDKVEKRGSVTEREKKKRAATCMLQPKTAAYSSWRCLQLRAHNSFAENLLSAEAAIADHLLTARSVGGHGILTVPKKA